FHSSQSSTHRDLHSFPTRRSSDLVIIPQKNESLAKIVDTVACGGVIAFRTDTFYGLGADPFNVAAVQRIKQLKGREERKPILIRSEEHTSEPSHVAISYAVFCLKK